MSSTRILRGSIVLLVANVAAGMLNYFFQIRAAARMEAVSYGQLNAWMAYLGLALTVASVSQIASNFFIWKPSAVRRAGNWILLLSGAGLVAFAVLVFNPSMYGPQTRFLFMGAAAFYGILFHFFVGQLQGRVLFGWMGFCVLLQAAVKVSATWLSAESPMGPFLLAFPLSYCLASLFLVIPLSRLHRFSDLAPRSSESAKWDRDHRDQLISAGVLSFALALAPQMDLLNLQWTQSEEAVGLYSRASLFARGIFFAAMTLLQISLPVHIRYYRGEVAIGSFKKMRLIETTGWGLCWVSSFVLGYLAPVLSRMFLGYDLSGYQEWVVLSCLCLTCIYGQIQRIQIQCSLSRWKTGLLEVLPFGAWMAGHYWFQAPSVETYLRYAFGFYLILSVRHLLTLRALRHSPRIAEIGSMG